MDAISHVHIIPRTKGDGLKLWPQKPYAEGEFEKTGDKIRASLQYAAQLLPW